MRSAHSLSAHALSAGTSHIPLLFSPLLSLCSLVPAYALRCAVVRECMARLYANFRQELLGCVEQSSALFGETLEQVDTAMLATRELFCRNDQDVAALQSEHEQQLVNVSNAAPQLQLLANMRK